MDPGQRHMRDDALNRIVPDDPKLPYDVREIVTRIVDRADFLEVQKDFAKNLVVGFATHASAARRVIANQPSCWPARWISTLPIRARGSFASAMPSIFRWSLLVDVPGFLPGIEQEHGGIIRHGAKLLFAYSAATVPKITVVMRKAYGGGYIAMCAKDLGADRVLAWPSAEIAVMGAEGAAEIVFRREIAAADDQEARRKELIEEYRETFATPYVSAGARLVDDIIEPADTRGCVAAALEALLTKRVLRPTKKHGNIPL